MTRAEQARSRQAPRSATPPRDNEQPDEATTLLYEVSYRAGRGQGMSERDAKPSGWDTQIR
jgi:hypothetical protein